MRPSPRRPRRLPAIALLAASMLAVLPACGDESDQIVFVADGPPNGRLAAVAVYVAAAKGYYAQLGLDVRIEHAETPGGQVRALEGGEAAFGTIGAGDLVALAAKDEAGTPPPVVAIALFEQRGDEGYLVREGSGIRAPADFAGQRVGSRQPNASPELVALLSTAGLSADDVTLEQVGADDLDRFLVGQVDVYPVALDDEPDRARRLGNDVVVIDPADFGIETLGMALVTRRDLLETEPDMVAAFLRATFRAAYYTSRHIDEAIEIALEYAPDADIDHLSVMLETDLLAAERRDGLGRGDAAQWEALVDLYARFGGIDVRVAPSDLFDGSLISGLYERGDLP